MLVTTIHQAKGREWDAVIAGSLCGPDLETDRIGRALAGHGVYSGEPADRIADFGPGPPALRVLHPGAPPAGADRQRRAAGQVQVHLG